MMRVSLSIKQFSRFILSLVIVAGAMGIVPARAQDQTHVDLRQFDLLTASSGWVLLDQTIFWTSDAGQTWQDISPSMPADAVVQGVRFIDPNSGWVLYSTPDPAGGALFHLAHTTDRVTWITHTLSLFESGEPASYAEKVSMDWLDPQHGWVSVKQSSGSNFSIGTLFTTSDGGETWHRSALPVADTVYFSDPEHGWAVGGPTGSQVFSTSDGGTSWQEVSPDKADNVQVRVYAPIDGLLVRTDVGAVNSLNMYRENSSGTWSLFGQTPLDTQPGLIGLSTLDAQNFVATIPGTATIVRMMDGHLEKLENKDGFSSSIVALDMISLEAGWAKSVISNCDSASSSTPGSVSVTCSSTTRLLHTSDGGQTWQSLSLPSDPTGTSRASALNSTSRTATMNSLSNMGNSQTYIGQGFDICEIPTLSQLQTWATNSPYKAINLYIGGSSRLCSNSALTSSYLRQLSSQGWKFIPTWVGPQAPCTSFLKRMSSDPVTSYNQGVAEADLAVETLADLGLTFSDKTGSVVYYDIEYYGTNTACRTAVNSFMNGWVSQIHTRGNLAGAYSSPVCNTGLSDFRSITNVPDVVWIAAWYYNIGDPRGTYDPTASVWDYLGSCMPVTAWPNHQRVRQYSGDHIETWGSLSLEIDNDILDGVVAVPYIPNLPQPVIPTQMPTRPKPVLQSTALTPTSLTTQMGTTSGSLSSLNILNQSGAEDNPAAYISFQTPNGMYLGYRSFLLPDDAITRSLSTVLLQVNFKGPASSSQIWTWSIYDWATGLWVKLGDSIGTEAGQWQSLLFRIRQPWRYISSGREIRIQLKSNNANGDARVDYEALHITYFSVPAVPTTTAPAITPRRPGVFSVPISTQSP